MFNWIPLDFYQDTYNYIFLLVVIQILIYSNLNSLESKENIFRIKLIGLFCLIFSLFYIGLRPISGKFLDMKTYDRQFIRLSESGYEVIADSNDYLFNLFTFISSKFISAEIYFFLCACLYILPLWFASKRWFKVGGVYLFVALIISFSFWNYGTNGIRNGIATSLFVFALSRKELWHKVLFFIIAMNVHNTMTLPLIGFLIAYFYTKPKYFLLFWIISIPVSLVLGSSFQILFSSFMEDDRSSYLTNENIQGTFSSTGFRWDFLLYSASAVFAGWYFIYKKNFVDKHYEIMYCTYLFTNAFWILVMKANFSNRFAYLSWFMMAIIIFYPLLKKHMFSQQYKVLTYVLLGYFSFTFFMNVILG